MVEPVDRSLYEDFENLARERVLTRDPDDWPIIAVALLLDFPIWTEDQDFFGSDVATLDHGQSRIVSTLNRETKNRTPLPSRGRYRTSAFTRAEVCVGEAVSHQ